MITEMLGARAGADAYSSARSVNLPQNVVRTAAGAPRILAIDRRNRSHVRPIEIFECLTFS
jgi:hypothetical protein